jgi:sodium-dependent dicarboxylate transporter 2/3/5
MGVEVSFVQWMLISIPLMAILLFFLWRMLLIIFPPGDVSIDVEKKESSDFSNKQKIIVLLFVLTVMGWVTGGLTGLSAGTVGIMIVVAAFGFGLLNNRDFRNISWDVLFMLGGGLCLGVGLNGSGLTVTIAEALPVGGAFWIALSLMVVVAAIMTTFMSNTATANLLIPVAVSIPQHEIVLAIAISIICSTAMALPVSTPPNAVAFGSGLLKSTDMLYPGLVITVLALVLVLIVSIFYVPLFF